MGALPTVVFDTKPYDRESLQRATRDGEVEWRFMDWRVSAETAASASGARAVRHRESPHRLSSLTWRRDSCSVRREGRSQHQKLTRARFFYVKAHRLERQ